MLRPPRRTVQPTAALQFVRTYVVSLKPSVIYPHKSVPRVYNVRKTYLLNQYKRLFQSSFESPVILFQHTDFSVLRLTQLRKIIHDTSLRHVTPPPSLSSQTPVPADGASTSAPALPTFTVMNTSIFGLALRDFQPIDAEAAKELAAMVEGGLAVLTFPTLNPPQLNALLRALSRNVPPRKPKTAEQIEQEKKEAEANFIPGRRPKRQRPTPVPDLKLVGALIEGRLFKADGVKNVAELPTLETLRAQLVGLLSAPATQLAMVLSEASGGKLARTLEGLKKSLEEDQDQGAPSESA